MGKSTFFTGQPIFNQLLSLIPEGIIPRLARKHNGDRYCKKFFTSQHVVTMLYACFFECKSLREITTGMLANGARLDHIRMSSPPRRSTISDANNKRSCEIFASLYHHLTKIFLSDSRWKKPEDRRLFLLDSTTVSLFSDVMKGAGAHSKSGKKKGGVKAHTLVDSAHDLPCFVHLTEARQNDRVVLPLLNLPQNSIIVFDKGYLNHTQFESWNKKSVTWVTRLADSSVFQQVSSLYVTDEESSLGVESDSEILLGRPSNAKKTPLIKARHVQYFDQEKKRSFSFITNDFTLSAYQITQLYKQRWQIELIFKRIKQRYPLRYFLGESPNAIQIQLWSALICDLLIKIIQLQVNARIKQAWSYSNIASMIKQHLMTYIKLIDFLLNPEASLRNYHPPSSAQGEFAF